MIRIQWSPSISRNTARETSLQTPADLDQKVGWYTFSDGVTRLVSFGETAGITLNRFDTQRDQLEQAYFERSTDLVFVGGGDASSTKRLDFELDLTLDQLGEVGGIHPGGANVAISDGSVRFMQQVTPAMITINDGR